MNEGREGESRRERVGERKRRCEVNHPFITFQFRISPSHWSADLATLHLQSPNHNQEHPHPNSTLRRGNKV